MRQEHKFQEVRECDMKTCTKCRTPKEATTENFAHDKNREDGLCPQCKVCQRKYRDSRKGEIKTYNESYYTDHKEEALIIGKQYYTDHREEALAKAKKRHTTIEGYLHNLYHNVNYRCAGKGESNRTYIEKGVKNKFESAEHLISYVVEILKVDPRGLDCHRIDNDGNYEPGNIEFIDHDEHMKLHREKKL